MQNNFYARLKDIIDYNIDCQNEGLCSIAFWQIQSLKKDFPVDWENYCNSPKAKEQAGRGKFLLEH